jgi:hypothetical protein
VLLVRGSAHAIQNGAKALLLTIRPLFAGRFARGARLSHQVALSVRLAAAGTQAVVVGGRHALARTQGTLPRLIALLLALRRVSLLTPDEREQHQPDDQTKL